MNDTDMGMDTPNAIHILNEGHDVRRKRWSPESALRKVKASIGPHEVEATMVVVSGEVTTHHIWHDEDIYATDWEIA